MGDQLKYVCINCGSPVKELHKKYSSSVLKIMNCDWCHEITDKYIEYEPVAILIDLILLTRSAYRHVLYNSKFRIFWKMTVVILLLESYILWKDKQWNTIEIKKQIGPEERFYISFALTVIDKFLLFVFLGLFSKMFDFFRSKNSTENRIKMNSINLLKSMTLASTARFFIIPILIWKNNTSDLGISLHLFLIYGYYLLCLIVAYSVLLNCPKTKSAVIIIVTMLIKIIAFNQISHIIKTYIW